MPPIDALQISTAADSAALSPAQKRFNTLLRQIEQARRKLADWASGMATFRQAFGESLAPMREQLQAGHRTWVFALDAALGRRGWTRTERAALTEQLLEAAGQLLDGGREDAELKALFDRHSDIGFDEEQREHVLAMKEMAEAMTGLDFGDDEGLDSEDALFERLHQGMHAQAQAHDAARAAKSAHRRPTAAQQRREDEARQATQSVREVYRQLASALHPDRAADERERAGKTALMQRVNQAYDANDLLALLELQLQIEQIDAGHIAGASEQRLKHYNKVLGEQVRELKTELEAVQMQFCMEFGVEPGPGLTPRKLGQLLEQTRRAWQADLAGQQRDLRRLDDQAATKRWLKRLHEEERRGGFGFEFF